MSCERQVTGYGSRVTGHRSQIPAPPYLAFQICHLEQSEAIAERSRETPRSSSSPAPRRLFNHKPALARPKTRSISPDIRRLWSRVPFHLSRPFQKLPEMMALAPGE